MGQSKNIKHNYKEPKNFDICFCVNFSCYDPKSHFWKGDRTQGPVCDQFRGFSNTWKYFPKISGFKPFGNA